MAMRTRPVSKYLHQNYLKKAEEFLDSAKTAYSKNQLNSSVANSVHAAISGSDALLVFFKEVRSAGETHEDVITLLKTLGLDPQEVNSKIKQLQRLLQIKNIAEYEEKLMSEQDAENCVKDAERFLDWVKQKLSIS